MSRPMRSASLSGPIGWAQPRSMPASMSVAVAKPDSAMRTAERRYGIRRALTTNPARSRERMAVLPSARVANSSTAAAVADEVCREVTTSTRGRTGTGLKKCSPTTRSARRVALPSRMTGREEVLVARIAPGSSTILSRASKTSVLTSACSVTASMTSCRSARSSRLPVKTSRARASSAPARSDLPRSTARSREPVTRSRAARAAVASASQTTVSSPARAQTSAMPAPIRPPPTTPTRVMRVVMAAPPGCGRGDGRRRRR